MVGGILSEPLVEVGGDRRRSRVNIGGERRHGGGEHRRNQQAGQSDRKLLHDEERKNLIALVHRHIQQFRLAVVIGIEAGSDEIEEDGNGNAGNGVEPNALNRRLFILRGDVALDDGLVAGVGEQIGQQSANEQKPDGRLVKGKGGINDFKLGVVDPQLNNASSAAIHTRCNIKEGHHGAGNQNNALDKVAPDNGLDPTHGAIDDRDDSNAEDAKHNVDSGNGFKRQRREVGDNPDPNNHEQDKHGTGEDPAR